MLIPHKDRDSYWKFTGPARLDKAVHTLEGVLQGIRMDGNTGLLEMKALQDWIDEYRHLSHRHPFNEVYPALESALADGKLEDDEVEDVIWLCQRINPDHGYYDNTTSDMQRLQGILGGIISDGRIAVDEIAQLRKWMEEHEYLRQCWPYDELDSLLTHVMKDQKIDHQEQRLLKQYFNEWTTIKGNRSLNLPLNEVNTPITGLCAVCPEVTIKGMTFCFTGASAKTTRKQFEKIVTDRGGKFWPRISQEVHYLVIGADGNPCWAYACYGRKVEQAVALRKTGHKLLLVHECDFWDALN